MNVPRFPRWIVAFAITSSVLALVGLSVAFAAVTTQTKVVSVPPGTSKRATAVCPAKMSVRLGGFVTSSSNPDLQIQGLKRSASGSWTITAGNYSGPSASATSIAYCSQGPTLTASSKTVSAPPNATARAIATCPIGQTVGLGGFSASFSSNGSQPQVFLSGLYRSSNRAWTVSGINLGGGIGQLSSIAYCGKQAQLAAAHLSVVVPSTESRSVTATCATNKTLAFGGFKADVGSVASQVFVLADKLVRSSNRTWTARAHNGGSQSGHLTAIAYCR